MSKVEELSGGIFNCFDDMSICLCGLCCPLCQLGQAMEDAGEQSCIAATCLAICIPCWFPCATSSQQETIDKKMGGQGMGFGKACLLQCCCSHCAVCMLARAVKKGKEQGILKRGAPQEEEMTA